MKILFFCRRFYPLIGGVEKHCLEIGRQLVKKGHSLTVVTEEPVEVRVRVRVRVKTEKIDGIKIFRIPITAGEKRKKFQIWKWLWKNRNLIKEADIVHCHDVFYWFLPFKFLFPFKKVFTTFHGYEGNVPKLNQILSHKMAKWLSKGTIAVGDWHEKWYGVKADFVSYGGMEEKTGEVGKREKKGKKKYNFCFVGRLAKDTGILVYLKALKILKEKGKNFSIVVCGDGPQGEEAQNFSKKNKLDVSFEGFVDGVGKYINNSDELFISGYLGILEGLAAKKFVYSVFDTPIKEDYLKLAPFSKMIFIAKDPLELARKILYFEVVDQEKKKLVKSGYMWAREQTWGRLVEIYLRLWTRNEGFINNDCSK